MRTFPKLKSFQSTWKQSQSSKYSFFIAHLKQCNVLFSFKFCVCDRRLERIGWARNSRSNFNQLQCSPFFRLILFEPNFSITKSWMAKRFKRVYFRCHLQDHENHSNATTATILVSNVNPLKLAKIRMNLPHMTADQRIQEALLQARRQVQITHRTKVFLIRFVHINISYKCNWILFLDETDSGSRHMINYEDIWTSSGLL
jgi:hypothetical protein